MSISLFPSYPWLTKDLALLILDKGSDKDVRCICQANRAWRQFMQNTPALHCRVVRNLCVSAARAINLDAICVDDSFLELKLNLLLKIAKIDPESDLEAVKKEALEGWLGLSLLKIIRWEAIHHLADAKKTSLRYAGRFPYLLQEIIKVEAKTDLIEARAMVKLMGSSAVQAQSLALIAEADDQNYAAAIDKAETIEDAKQKFYAYQVIAKCDPRMDLTILKTLAARIEDQWSRYSAFIQIIKMEARRDLAAAKATVALIDQEGERGRAFVEIAKVEVLTDPASVLMTALQLPNNELLFMMVKVLAPYDLNGARTLVQQMDDEFDYKEHKCKALKQLVKYEVRHDRVAAIETAKTIEDDYIRIKAFIEIAKWDPQDFQFAKAEAEKLEFDCSEALLKIVKIEVLSDLNIAVATARRIEKDLCRLKAFVAIGKAAFRQLQTSNTTYRK